MRARIDLNPLRAFDADHPGTREVMASAPLLLDHLDADDAEHFAAVRAMLDAVELPYEIDPTLVRGLDYYTRTVFEFTSRRARRPERRRRRRALRRPGRAARRRRRRPAWAGRRASSGCCSRPRSAPSPSRSATSSSRWPATSRRSARRRSRWPPRRAARACRRSSSWPGRSLKGQLKQAARLQARYVAVLGDEGIELKDMESGEQETVAEQLGGRRARAAREARRMKPPRSRTRYRDSLVRRR